MQMTAFWGISILCFLIAEGVSLGITSIWFALGSLAALISAVFGAPVWLQIIWFVAVTGVTLWLTRPLVKKYVNAKRQPTNADRILGQVGIITETVNNLAGIGSVKIGGKLWTARSASGQVIEQGSEVIAQSIEGVKLIVIPIPVPEEENVPENIIMQEEIAEGKTIVDKQTENKAIEKEEPKQED